ncbi:hypothetical protein [Methanoregula sp.]|uniref:hypothetical protein n=1 Tax=Methanoregula sp. TaxID=2052170 RepID=UPI00262AD69C|nr:hypothetical protein [Methanoregula sp.]MDD5142186.1 hypothetical protein [Methanoregula sp.]
MDRRIIAMMGMLVLAGLALAFAVAFIAGGENGRAEDIWLIRNTQSAQAPGHPSEKGLDSVLKTMPENETPPRPVVTTNWSNASKTTIKLETIAHNQSATLILYPDGKLGRLLLIDRNNPETKTGTLTPEQRNLAEDIALADARVREIIGAGMYTINIQSFDCIQVKNSEEIPLRGTGVSIVFTTVNTTTARNETTFIVHVDLDKENVVRVSPPIPVSE